MRSIRYMAAALAATAVILSSCGSTAAPTPASGGASPLSTATQPSSPRTAATPTPSPTPSATATPVDVSAAFNEAITDPLFEARIDVTGSVTASGVEMPMRGQVEIRAGSSHTRMTVSAPGGDQTTETIISGGRTYTKAYGVWFEESGTASSAGTADLGTVLRNVGGFRDTGIESKAGRQLHHLELPAGASLPASAVGLASPGITNVQAGLEAWGDESGRPVLMTITASWDQAAGERTIPATMAIDYQFTKTTVTISAPIEVWAWNTSKVHAYKVAYPSDWEVKPGSAKGMDYYNSYDGTWIGVWHGKREGWTLNQVTSAITRDLKGYSGLKGAKLDSNTGLKVAGVKARRLVYRGTYEGDRMWATTIVVVKGAYLYEFDYYLYHQPSEAETARFNTFLVTFAFK